MEPEQSTQPRKALVIHGFRCFGTVLRWSADRSKASPAAMTNRCPAIGPCDGRPYHRTRRIFRYGSFRRVRRQEPATASAAKPGRRSARPDEYGPSVRVQFITAVHSRRVSCRLPDIVPASDLCPSLSLSSSGASKNEVFGSLRGCGRSTSLSPWRSLRSRSLSGCARPGANSRTSPSTIAGSRGIATSMRRSGSLLSWLLSRPTPSPTLATGTASHKGVFRLDPISSADAVWCDRAVSGPRAMAPDPLVGAPIFCPTKVWRAACDAEGRGSTPLPDEDPNGYRSRDAARAVRSTAVAPPAASGARRGSCPCPRRRRRAHRGPGRRRRAARADPRRAERSEPDRGVHCACAESCSSNAMGALAFGASLQPAFDGLVAARSAARRRRSREQRQRKVGGERLERALAADLQHGRADGLGENQVGDAEGEAGEHARQRSRCAAGATIVETASR